MDKIDIMIKMVTKDEEGHFITVTGSIHQNNKYCKYICPYQQNPKIHEEKLDTIERKKKFIFWKAQQGWQNFSQTEQGKMKK